MRREGLLKDKHSKHQDMFPSRKILTLVVTRVKVKIHVARETLILDSIPAFVDLDVRMPNDSLLLGNFDKL